MKAHTCVDKNKDGKCDTCGSKMGKSYSHGDVAKKTAGKLMKGAIKD